jgi:hypothetical protein
MEKSNSSKPAPKTAVRAVDCSIELGQMSPFSSNYPNCAPVPVIAFHGTGPLHRFVLKRREWNTKLILLEKAAQIVRSDRWETGGLKEWHDIVIDEGGGIFIYLDGNSLCAFADDFDVARNAALAFRDRFSVPISDSNGRYYLITSYHDNIDTEPVDLRKSHNHAPDDLDLLYGHGFAGWVDSYSDTLMTKNSGLTLLEGPPGTGKTSFLRQLIHRMRETHRFYFVPPANVGLLSNPEFIGFWSRQHASNPEARFVCVLEDAEGLLMVRGNDNRRQAGAILNITDGLLADFLRLQIVCSINCHSSEIDPAFMRPGRLVAHRIFSRMEPQSARRIAEKFDRLLPIQKDYSLAEIFNADERQCTESPRIGFAA